MLSPLLHVLHVLRLLLLLLLHVSQATAKGGGEGWHCPSLAPSPSLSCSCDLPHTLRCDGDLPDGEKKAEVLAKLVEQVASLPENTRVALLDLSVRNLDNLPGRLLSKVGVEGLVVSSGQLANVSDKAFVGLEDQLTALGLPGNQLTRVPVQALSLLKHLSRLDLSGNQLPSLLALPSLPTLEFLALQGNRITVLAAGVFQAVPHLRTLQLAGNQLSASSIYQFNVQHLSYLSNLDLSSNLLSGALSPPSLDLFPPNLRALDLSLNSISKISSHTFTSLSRLTSLSLEGNAVEKVEDDAFLGLTSLASLDLSHNSIVTLATDSLAGLPSLKHLNLAHNHLQVVSESLVPHSPLLSTLLLMDNDISTVADGALDLVEDLKQLDLTGNPLDCDCHLSYLHNWLTSTSTSSSTSTSTESSATSTEYSATPAHSTALCATPPALANAPLASLPSPPTCSEDQLDSQMDNLDSQMDTPRSDYYEYYYSEPGSDTSPTFLSSAELHLASSSYQPTTHKLELVWQLEEAALPYTCGQLHVFQESQELGPLLVLQNALDCSSQSQPSPSLLPVTVDLAGHNLSLTEAYIFCISLLQDASVIPGCSGALHLQGEQTEVRTLEQQASLHHLHANVSTDGSEVTISLETKVPPAMKNSCLLKLSLSLPTSPPIEVASTSLNCSTSLHTFSHLAPHTYYNVCAALHVEAGSSPRAQCLLAAAPRLRTAPRSVMPLLLTLVFLALGIACLTVLYLIVRRHREDSHHRVFLTHSTVSPLMAFCWKLRRRKGPPAFFLDNGEDDLP